MKLDVRLKFILFFLTLLLFPISAAGSNSIDNGANGAYLRSIIIVAIFAMYFLVLTWYITKNYLTPLKKLLDAIKTVADGNFDFRIAYNKNNEMGSLCAAFDLMSQKLKASLERQAELENSRKELISSISHDLRTPLSSIKGYVEGLPKTINDPERMSRYISVIQNKTNTLDNLIERLFAYSQLDIESRPTALSVWDSSELLERIIRPIELEFVELPIRFEVKRPLPTARLRACEDEIAQVFDNIISNGMRYIGENGVITLEAISDEENIIVSITDNGSGISQEDLPHVFEQFYRAEKSRSRSFGGAGLGLAICKKIIEQHGGKIWVESDADVLTRFRFALPIITTEY